jgi:NAD dependent epimerase/dehydratase family
MHKKVLISGGAGFIGTHLTELLNLRASTILWLDSLDPQIHGDIDQSVSMAKSKGVKLILGDVKDRAAWRQAISGVDAIVHFAAQTGTGQSMYRRYRLDVGYPRQRNPPSQKSPHRLLPLHLRRRHLPLYRQLWASSPQPPHQIPTHQPSVVAELPQMRRNRKTHRYPRTEHPTARLPLCLY